MALYVPRKQLLPEKDKASRFYNDFIADHVAKNNIVFAFYLFKDLIPDKLLIEKTEKQPLIVVDAQVQKDVAAMVTKEMSQLAVQYCLNVAAANGLDEMLHRVLLLVEDTNLDWTHPITGDTALLTAVKSGRESIVALLFSKGADPNKINQNTQASAFTYAVERGDIAMLRKLLKISEFDINADVCLDASQDQKCSPIVFASKRGHKEVVQLLLSGTETQQCKVGDVQQAMLYASEFGRRELIPLFQAYLKDKKPVMTRKNVEEQRNSIRSLDGSSGLSLFKLFVPGHTNELIRKVKRGHVKSVEDYVFENGASCVNEEIVLQSIAHDDAQMLEVLLSFPKVLPTLDPVPLFSQAVLGSSKGCLRVLCNSYIDPETGANKNTRLTNLVLEHYLVEQLLESFQEGELLETVQWDRLPSDVVADMLDKCVDLGNHTVLDKLLEHSGYRKASKGSESLIMYVGVAAAGLYFAALDLILDYDETVSYKEATVSSLMFPYAFTRKKYAHPLLCVAICEPYLMLLDYLKRKNKPQHQLSFDYYITSEGQNRSLLFECAKSNNIAAMKLLLQFPTPSLQIRDEAGNTLLHCCDSEEMALEVLKVSESEDILLERNENQESALRSLLQRRWYKCAERLVLYSKVKNTNAYFDLCWQDSAALETMLKLNYRPKAITAPCVEDGSNDSIFKRACNESCGNPVSVLLLLEKFPEVLPQPQPELYGSPWHFGCKNGLLEVVEALLDLEFDCECINDPDVDGFTPLQAAVHSGNYKLVTLLLEQSESLELDCNVETVLGTAATYAADRLDAAIEGQRDDVNRIETLRVLVECTEVDLTIPHEGESILMKLAATTSSIAALVDPLELRLQADPELVKYKNPTSGNTALHVAAMCGSREMLLLILGQKGIDVDPVNEDHRTPLHFAVNEANPEAVRMLLASCADRDIADVNSFTPLDIATNRSLDEIVSVLDPRTLKRQLSVSSFS